MDLDVERGRVSEPERLRGRAELFTVEVALSQAREHDVEAAPHRLREGRAPLVALLVVDQVRGFDPVLAAPVALPCVRPETGVLDERRRGHDLEDARGGRVRLDDQIALRDGVAVARVDEHPTGADVGEHDRCVGDLRFPEEPHGEPLKRRIEGELRDALAVSGRGHAFFADRRAGQIDVGERRRRHVLREADRLDLRELVRVVVRPAAEARQLDRDAARAGAPQRERSHAEHPSRDRQPDPSPHRREFAYPPRPRTAKKVEYLS